jgi:2-polyprenyl-3-methyl-5-hydroxy-6-metoxy-1,4-benzoquinol methylase
LASLSLEASDHDGSAELSDTEALAVKAVDAAIAELKNFQLLASAEMDAGYHETYVSHHRAEYVRTVRDVLEQRPPSQPPIRVLEIGAFFGVVCIALASLGYEVTAADVPEYIDLPEQAKRYGRFGIATKGIRLEEFILPFEDEQFDLVIMCEVIEHLNFNPLPLLKEINRVGAPGSIFYVSMPNATSIYHRVAVAKGYAGGVQVSEFFEQLDPGNSLIANGHWREYTAAETRQLLEPLGYRIVDQYYFSIGDSQPSRSMLGRVFRLFLRRWPQFKENQTTIAVREKRTDMVFDIPQTVHPTLRQL